MVYNVIRRHQWQEKNMRVQTYLHFYVGRSKPYVQTLTVKPPQFLNFLCWIIATYSFLLFILLTTYLLTYLFILLNWCKCLSHEAKWNGVTNCKTPLSFLNRILAMLYYPFLLVYSQLPCDQPEDGRSCSSDQLCDAWTAEMEIMPSVLLETSDLHLAAASKGVMHQ